MHMVADLIRIYKPCYIQTMHDLSELEDQREEKAAAGFAHKRKSGGRREGSYNQ